MIGIKCFKFSKKGNIGKTSYKVLMLAFVFITALLAVPKPVTKAENLDALSNIKVSRLAGNDRYATSVTISKQGWTSSDYAILATGEDYPDALAAAPLAKKYACPIILISKYSIKDSIMAELKRLSVKEAFILGGTGVIANSVEKQLTDNKITPTRIAGADRYETSVKIAQKLGTSDEIIVATGEDFADALSISSVASSKNIPILLTSKNALASSVANFIKSKKIYKSYIVGNTDCISQNLFNQLAGSNPERIGGTDKYERNININKEFAASLDYSTVYIATGNDFPDSLGGGALASLTDSPVILVNDFNGDTVKEFLKDKNVKNLVVLGGIGAVPENVKNAVLGTADSSQALKTVTVSSSKELMENIAPNTKIILKAGNYDLLNPKVLTNKYIKYSEVFDGYEVILNNITNLTLEADAGAKVNLLIDPRYANVLSFNNCSNINISGLVAGHYPDKGACVGGVFKFEDSSNIQINNSDLYGCGIEGLTLNNVKNLQFINSTIRDCSYGVMTINSSSNISFSGSTFKDNKEYYGINVSESDLTFDKCTISNNKILGDYSGQYLFDMDLYSTVKLTNSAIVNNTAKYLTDGGQNFSYKDTTFTGNTFDNK